MYFKNIKTEGNLFFCLKNSTFSEAISTSFNVVYDTKKGDEIMQNKMEYQLLNKVLVVDFYGEVDSSNAPKYRQELDTLIMESKGDVIFYFTHTTFIDSSGIGLILGRYNQLKLEGRKLKLSNLNNTAYKVFELTGIFNIMEYVEEGQKC
jgi:stage II sporulation protein AA (anti-sigma F factor antagonist)